MQRIKSLAARKRLDDNSDDKIYKLKLDDWVILKVIWKSKQPISSDEIYAHACPRFMKEGQAYMTICRLVYMELIEAHEGDFEGHKRAFYTPLVTEQDVLAHCEDLIDRTLTKLEYIFDVEGEGNNGLL